MSMKTFQLPDGYLDNFLLKVNGKLGINFLMDPTMDQYWLFIRTMFVGLTVHNSLFTYPVHNRKSNLVQFHEKAVL